MFAHQQWRFRQGVRRHADAILWRGAAFALMVNLLLFPERFPPASIAIGRAYSRRYWRPANFGEWLDILVAILIWPAGVLLCALWFTGRNGPVVAKRFGRPLLAQLREQLRLAVTSGLLPPWYYIFELYRPGGMDRAHSYLTRGQTKHGVYCALAEARGSSSPLGDKHAFERFCAERRIATLPVLAVARDGEMVGPAELPAADLFVKPVRGRGGRGAERWDYAGEGRYRHCDGRVVNAPALVEHLRILSRVQPYLMQERATNHPAMRDLSNGALNTIRIITCLDERDRPEVIAAVLRMAAGDNVTVDNVHAGGLAASVDLSEGRLSQATDMGVDAHLGWIDRHPDTGGQIAGRVLPMWSGVCDLVRTAHAAFRDWAVIGWDVAIMADRPRLVEGNSGPDIDLVQRPLRTSFGDARFGTLLAHQLAKLDARPVLQPRPAYSSQRSMAGSSVRSRQMPLRSASVPPAASNDVKSASASSR